MKKIVGLVMCLLLIFVFVACSASPSVEETSGAQDSTDKAAAAADNSSNSEEVVSNGVDKSEDLYVAVTVLSGLDYFVDWKRALKAAEEEMGIKTEFVGPTEYDMTGQVAAIEQALAKKPVGLILMGWEEAMNPVIDKAIDQGVMVYMCGADLPNSNRVGFIGSGNRNIGSVAADYVADLVGGKGQVAVLRNPGLNNVVERFEGFKARLEEEYPEIEIVADLDNQNDSTIAAQQVTNTMQKYPDLAAVFACDGISGPGAAVAVREAGMVGKVSIIAMDRDDAVLQGIQDGVITATIAQGTSLEPYLAIKYMDMMKYSSVQLSYDDATAGITLAPVYTDTGAFVVDINNVEFFRRDYEGK